MYLKSHSFKISYKFQTVAIAKHVVLHNEIVTILL